MNSMIHTKMFKQHYDEIPRYTKQVHGDRFPQVDMNIPIKRMLMPLQNKIIEVDTSNTTKFGGEYNFLYRGEKYMKITEAGMDVKVRVASFNFVYGVTGGRIFYQFQTKWLNKQMIALIGDIITIINRLRLESNREKVNVIDVNIKNMNKLKQCVDLSCKS